MADAMSGWSGTVSPALEEVIEESGVTEVRNGFLQLIERMQENPALRILIKKHGRNRAVLMSAETYSALQRLVELVVRHSDAMPEDERLQRAFERLEDERGASRWTYSASDLRAANPEGAKVILSQMEGMLRELQVALEPQAEKEAAPVQVQAKAV